MVEPPAGFRAMVWKRIEAQEEARRQSSRPPRAAFDWRRLFTRPALAWAAAACFLFALAGVAVPGRYTSAGLYFPFSLFRTASQPEWTVSVGRASVVTSADGSSELIVPLTSNRTDVSAITVRVLSGPLRIVPGQERVQVEGGHAEAKLELKPVRSMTSIALEVGGRIDGADLARTISVRMP